MTMTRLRLKTGDTVLVRTGKDAGKRGKVLQVFPQQQRIVVEGVNTMTKNIRSRQSKDKGQRVQFNNPIHASNVMLVDPKTNQPTRLGSLMLGDKKVRRSVRSKQAIE